MCIEHAGGMFIRQCAHCRIPLCFAQHKAAFSRTDFPAKHASESLHLRHKRQAILIEIACLFLVKYHSLCEWYKKLIAIQGDIQEKPPEVR